MSSERKKEKKIIDLNCDTHAMHDSIVYWLPRRQEIKWVAGQPSHA